ncbi:MAG: hypothetical protein SFX18_03540 [Pirellulales bacterium]|nr:hypothetical protein [Pirellulales bacterium]
MSKLLALEWDDHEIRAVAGSPRGTELVLEHIWRMPLPVMATAGDGVPNGPVTLAPEVPASTITNALKQAIADRGLRKTRTLVSIGRSNLELKDLSLPPAPDEDLPELVRFQALREFNNYAEDWPLDYLPIPGDPAQPRSVLAAALPPSALQAIRQICHNAGLQLDSVVLRPCAAASLVNQCLPDQRGVRLLVDILAEEIDLTVLVAETPQLMRTARLHPELPPAELQRALLNEIRRTLASASNRLHGRRIDSVILCGDDQQQAELAKLLEQELKLPITTFDPLRAVVTTPAQERELPAQHSHFAPLIGLLAGAARETRPLLDFLHPRQKPVPQSQSRVWALAGSLAAVATLALVALGWWKLSLLSGELSTLNKQISTLQKNVKPNETFLKETTEIDTWLTADLPLIKELSALSRLLPPAKELKITQLNYSATKTGGVLRLNGVVNDLKQVQAVAQAIEGLNQQSEPTAVNTASATKSSPTTPATAQATPSTQAGTPNQKNPPGRTLAGRANAAPTRRYLVKIDSTDADTTHKGYSIAFKLSVTIDNPSPITAQLGPAAAKSRSGTTANTRPVPGRTS